MIKKNIKKSFLKKKSFHSPLFRENIFQMETWTSQSAQIFKLYENNFYRYEEMEI